MEPIGDEEFSMTNFIENLATPLGAMEIEATDDAVISIHFVDTLKHEQPNFVTNQAKQQLTEYFAGEREEFALPLLPQGTEFQHTVWRALSTIEFGQTCSYSDIANQIQNPKAVRAVGSANGKNPLTIVVPCHRVIGSSGSLTGYASGIDRKQWLLNHEANKLF
jgi:methylated-DNA-[protein]-cysteine S-methyltransferase